MLLNLSSFAYFWPFILLCDVLVYDFLPLLICFLNFVLVLLINWLIGWFESGSHSVAQAELRL